MAEEDDLKRIEEKLVEALPGLAEPCICTEPPSDSARRAGMSWGGVSATISGACPLCQEGCPPECKSLKPHGYYDAPQWQKDAWDSDTNKLMQAAAQALKEPSSGGWAMPSETVYADYEIAHLLDMSQLQVKRGGIYYPRFRVETLVQTRKPHWWSRRTWNLHVRYWDPAQKRYMNHIMEGFPAENLADNAAEIIKFTVQMINEQYNEEKRRGRK